MANGYQINLTRGKITVDSITCKNKRLIYTTKSMYLMKVNNYNESIYAEFEEGLVGCVSSTHSDAK
jgi:hypothetical protein